MLSHPVQVHGNLHSQHCPALLCVTGMTKICGIQKKFTLYSLPSLLPKHTRERRHPPLHLLPTFLLFLLQTNICQLHSTTVPVLALTHQLSTLSFLRCCCLSPHCSFSYTGWSAPLASLANSSSIWCSQEGAEALMWAHAEAAFSVTGRLKTALPSPRKDPFFQHYFNYTGFIFFYQEKC